MNSDLPFDRHDAPAPSAHDADEPPAPGWPVDGDLEWDLSEPYVDDPAEATDRMLEVIAAVDFLRRGDRRGITLWAAIEEALRWWVAERTAVLDGYVDLALQAPRFGESETMRTTLLRLIAVAGQDEPVHISQALQEALRRWSMTMADRYNDHQPWPAPALRHRAPVPLRLISLSRGDPEEPPDLIA